MNSLDILAALTAIAAAWTIRSLYLDVRRAERRVTRLRADNSRLRLALDEAEIDMQLWSEITARANAQDRHPSAQQYGGGNLRVVRDA